MTETICRCGEPTRDAAYTCDTCCTALSRALGEIPWLTEELEVTITGQRGVDYRSAIGGGKGARTAPRGDRRIAGDMTKDSPKADTPALGAHIQNDPANMAAADARAHLRAILVSWVKFCHDEHVRNSSPDRGLPADNMPALSRYLLWRVDGLALHDIGPDAVDEITDAVKRCHRVIDRPADRQYLGDCQEDDCAGRMYARAGAEFARCDDCVTPIRADEIRKRMLGELEDRLCTAAEIAHLSTYLGLKADRIQVRKRINHWAEKKQVVLHASVTGETVFRFGEVYLKLRQLEHRAEQKSA